MGDDRGYANLGMLLNAIVVIALVGTFVIYGNRSQSGSTAAESANMVTLDVLH
jgi:hypothetical protein